MSEDNIDAAFNELDDEVRSILIHPCVRSINVLRINYIIILRVNIFASTVRSVVLTPVVCVDTSVARVSIVQGAFVSLI